MRRHPVLSATACGSPMSATYPPESQQSPPQPPPEVRPPRKRRRVRKTLLIIGSALAALILVIVVISVATSSNSIKPAVAPSATHSTPTAQSYPSAASLLAAMAAHGATCSGVSLSYGDIVAGEVNPHAGCNGVSSGDTAVVVFTDHASALAYANDMISVGQQVGSPAAEVVGPNWTVNTVPAFAHKVISAVGGQLIAAAASPATPSTPAAAPSTPPPSSSVAQFGRSNGFTYKDGTGVSVISATPATLSQEAAGGNPGDPGVIINVRVTAGSTSLDASQIQVSANAGPDGTQLNSVFDTNISPPTGTLAPGQHGTYSFEFDLQQASLGVSSQRDRDACVQLRLKQFHRSGERILTRHWQTTRHSAHET
jgi:hypothetical protein